MIQQVVFSQEFERAFKRLKKRYPSLPEDVKQLLLSLQNNPYQGVELTDGMRKIRLVIKSKGRGKSGGARVIIQLTLLDTKLSMLYIYDKSETDSVSEVFLRDILKRLNE